LLTGERGGYYAEYADTPIEMLARAWREGFIWQGEASPYREGAARGEPSAHLPPASFVAFLQNHDQIGNRAFGERLAALVAPERNHAALAFLLLSPFIPMLFMGEEYGEKNPFLYFTAYQDGLATAVRDGRRKEFAKFPEFTDASKRARIPDPNDSATFAASRLHVPKQSPVREQVQKLIALRKREITPWLDRKSERQADVLDDRALHATWRREDGRALHICVNFGDNACPAPVVTDSLVYATSAAAASAIAEGRLEPATLVAWLD
jgi:maltooligosyltrehalose trehalohydrolase